MKRLLPLLFGLTLAASCVEPIVMDPMEEMPVVVQCVLTKDRAGDGMFYGQGYMLADEPEDNTVQYLDLYYARRPGETGIQRISDAIVQIKEGEERNAKKYLFTWNGSRWEASFGPKYGTTYILEIMIPGRTDHIFARTTFPANCLLGRYRIQKPSPFFYAYSPAASAPSANAPAALAPAAAAMPNSGTSKLSRYFALMNWSVHVEWIASNTYTVYPTSQIYPGEAFLWVTAEENEEPCELLYTDHPGADDFNAATVSWDEMGCLEEMRKLDITQPYTGDVDPIFWDQYERRCTGLPLHKKFLRIRHPADFDNGRGADSLCAYTDRSWSKNLFTLGVDFKNVSEIYSYSSGKVPYRLTVRMVSKEYDRYLRDVIKNTELRGDEFTTLYSTDPCYTNIEGGIGCFGSMISLRAY